MATQDSTLLRHEYARVLSVLLRQYGPRRLPLIEDAIGQAMLEAVTAWRSRGAPDNRGGWLYRAAQHRLIDELRRQKRTNQGRGEQSADELLAPGDEAVTLEGELADDELRALFACAHPKVPQPAQLVLALRTLCGFSSTEIATRLVTTTENVQKRYERAREALRDVEVCSILDVTEVASRRDSVMRMLYVMFTEGYFASSGQLVLRLELCVEAIRLGRALSLHSRSAHVDATALLALMLLHHARRDARVNDANQPVLLEDQDRAKYRRDELALALKLLQQASQQGLTSKYHLEAAIAGEHAFAPTFAETRWGEIAKLYAQLSRIDPSPLHDLHGLIAVSYADGPRVALDRLQLARPPTWLQGSHLWLATRADLHRRLGEVDEAKRWYEQAIALAPPIEAAVLQTQMAKL